MRKEEKEFIAERVQIEIMPIIKNALPWILGWLFPKLSKKIIEAIEKIFEELLKKRDNG